MRIQRNETCGSPIIAAFASDSVPTSSSDAVAISSRPLATSARHSQCLLDPQVRDECEPVLAATPVDPRHVLAREHPLEPVTFDLRHVLDQAEQRHP